MHPECIKRIKDILGDTEATPELLSEIEKIAKEALDSSKADGRSSNLGSKDMVAELSRKAEDILFQKNGLFAVNDMLETLGKAPSGSHLKSLIDTTWHKNVASLEARVRGEQANAKAPFKEFHDLGTKHLGFAHDPTIGEKLFHAIRGVETGHESVDKFGKVYRGVVDKLTAKAEKMGILHPLENWLSPQADESFELRRTGKDAWVKHVRNLIDEDVYAQKGVMGEALGKLLGDVWETKVSEGRNKMLANRGAVASHTPSIGGSKKQPRQLFLKAEHYSEYMQHYGKDGVTAGDLVSMSIDTLVRDIEVARTYGGNAHEAFRFIHALATENDMSSAKTTRDVKRIDGQRKELQTLWERLTISSEKLDRELSTTEMTTREIGEFLKTWQVVKSFGQQVFSALPEFINCVVLSSHRLGRPMMSALGELKAHTTNAEYRAGVKSSAFATESAVTGMLNEFHNSSKLVSGMKVLADKSVVWQGLKAVDKFIANFSYSFTSSWMGEITRGFDNLNAFKAKYGEQAYTTLVHDFNFKENDLKALSHVELENGRLLTPDGIRGAESNKALSLLAEAEGKSVERMLDDISSKYSGFIWAMTQDNARGSVHSSLRDTKYTSSRGGRPYLSLLSQFLVTPLSLAEKHLITVPAKLAGGSNGLSAWSYRAKFLAFGLVAEATLTHTARRLLSGEKPDDLKDPTILVPLLARSLTHYDRFFNEYHDDFESLIHGIPVASTIINLGDAVLDRAKLTFKEIVFNEDVDEEKKSRANAKAAKEVLNNMPLHNLWYYKAFHRMVVNEVCEMLNEGYKDRLQDAKEKTELRKSLIG